MNERPILVLTAPGESYLPLEDELRQVATIVVGDSARAFEQVAAEVEVILNWSGRLSLIRQVFLISHRLRWIHSRSAGLERTLFPELIASGVTLTNGSGVFSPSLGEFALAAILYFAKDFRRMIRNQMTGLWEPFNVTMASGQTVGIVGYGDIGSAVAARVRALGMTVLGLKRHISLQYKHDPVVDQIYGSNQRLEMLPRCDYVVVAAPLNEETRGLIGEAEFAVMKKNAVLINIGRGPVVSEGAMIKALSEKRIKGAALDVFDEEPLPNGHPFYTLENVLLSPHCADHTPDWLDNAMRFFLAQLERFRRGETLLNIVDKQLGY
ncbi:MAG: hydroxyacid dehydrogenase [Acidobacteria bacterium]|nr:MAG: hydroxyacid dehydrogenase [Acidobacteriota bacterium]PYY06071.1 MAG: hydroxyacid dehydrogenase [Acidobacteriota bacterium]